MPVKDVELRLKGRDELSAPVSQIADKVKKLDSAINGLKSGGKETSPEIGKLFNEFKRLKSVLGDLGGSDVKKSIGQISQELTKQKRTLNETNKQLKENRAQHEANAKSAQKLSKSHDRLTASAEKSANTLAKETDKLKQVTAAAKLADKEQVKAVATRDRTAAKLEKERGKLASLGVEYEKIQKQIKALDKPNQNMQRALTAKGKRVSEAGKKVRQYERDLARAEKQILKKNDSLAKANAKLATHSERVAKATTKHEGFQQQVAESSDGLKRMTAAQDKLSASIERGSKAQTRQRILFTDTRRQLERAKRDEAKLRAQFQRADTRARAGLLPAYREQSGMVASTRAEYRRLQGVVGTLARQMRQAGGGTDEMRRAFEESLGALRKTKAELREQEGALGRLGSLMKRTATSVEGMENRTREANSVIERSRQGLNKLAGVAEVAKTALDRLAAAQARLSTRRAGESGGSYIDRMTSGINNIRRLSQQYARNFDIQRILQMRAQGPQDQGVVDRARAGQDSVNVNALGSFNASMYQQRMGEANRQLKASFEALNPVVMAARQGLQAMQETVARTAPAAETLAQRIERLRSVTSRLFPAIAKVRAETRGAARQQGIWATAIRQFYGDTRKALSFMQRLRGELLSLLAAYGGFFAIIQGIQRVMESTRMLESATNRFKVVAKGDLLDSARAMDFVRRTASRLGIQFGILATEYSKFAIATQGTNLEGEQTRKIFTAVAEAARVNNLDMKGMQGVFVALTQIVSKGAVSMEELRQQMGDRLPGAIQILADAIKMPVAEMYKLIEQGKLSSDVLADFGVELRKRFGDQLPETLTKLQTALGRLQNQAFLSFAQIGDAGAGQGFTDLLNTISDTLASAEFVSFLERISSFLTGLSSVAGFLVSNFQVVIWLMSVIISMRFAPVVNAIVASMQRWRRGAVRVRAALRLVRAELAASQTQMAGYGRRMKVLAGGFRSLLRLLATSGGTTALFVIGASLMTTWLTRSTDINEVLIETEKLVDKIKNAYERVGSEVSKLKKEVADLSIVETEALLTKANQSKQAAFRELYAGLEFNSSYQRGYFDTNNRKNDLRKQMQDAVWPHMQALRNGELAFDQFAKNVDRIAERFAEVDPETKAFFDEFAEGYRKMRNADKAVRDLTSSLKVLKGVRSGDQPGVDEGLGRTGLNVIDDPSKIDSGIPSGDEEAKTPDDLARDWRKVTDALRQYRDNLAKLKDRQELVGLPVAAIKETSERLADANVELAELYGKAIAVLQPFAAANDSIAALVERMREAKLEAENYGLEPGKRDKKDTASGKDPTEELVDQWRSRIDALREYRDNLASLKETQEELGAPFEDIEATSGKLDNVNERLAEMYEQAIKVLEPFAATNDAIAALVENMRQGKLEAENFGNEALLTMGDVADMLSGGVNSGLSTFIDELADGEKRIKAFQRAWKSFALSVLKGLQDLIVKQLVYNAVIGAAKAFGGSAATKIFHEGGIVGRDGGMRMVPLSALAGARRFHSGGMPGLGADEVPAILQKGEEVLSRTDPRNALNGGGESATNVYNLIDYDDLAESIARSPAGEKAVLNVIRKNPSILNR